MLTVADLTVGFISVLTDLIWRITVEWHAGNIACKVIRFLQATVTYSSTYVLVALSIDRYDAITHPMNFSGSCKYRIRVLCKPRKHSSRPTLNKSLLGTYKPVSNSLYPPSLLLLRSAL